MNLIRTHRVLLSIFFQKISAFIRFGNFYYCHKRDVLNKFRCVSEFNRYALNSLFHRCGTRDVWDVTSLIHAWKQMVLQYHVALHATQRVITPAKGWLIWERGSSSRWCSNGHRISKPFRWASSDLRPIKLDSRGFTIFQGDSQDYR